MSKVSNSREQSGIKLLEPCILEPVELRAPCLFFQKELGAFVKKRPVYHGMFNKGFEEEGNLLIDSLEFPETTLQTHIYILGYIESGKIDDLVKGCCGLKIELDLEKFAERFQIYDLHQRVLDSFETGIRHGDVLLGLSLFKTGFDPKKQIPKERIDICECIKLHGIDFDEHALWAKLVKFSESENGTRMNYVGVKYIYGPGTCANFEKFVNNHSDNLDGLTGRDVVYTTMFAKLAQDKIWKKNSTS